MTVDTIILRGSYGDLTVNRSTGSILGYDNPSRPAGDAADGGSYSDILYILPETLAPGRDSCLDTHGETDILSVGFVCSRGLVTMPNAWDQDREMWGDAIGALPQLDCATA